MTAGPGVARIAAGRIALAGAVALPFVFGGVVRAAWEAAALSFVLCAALSASAGVRGPAATPFHGVFLALHAICAVQLVPLPATALRWISPGSFYLASPDAGPAIPFSPISVSPGATLDAWLWIAGLHALHIVAARWFAADADAPARVGAILAFVASLLAAQALLQRTGPEPDWLYGVVPIDNPAEKGIMGPFFNRNAFSAMVSMGGALALASALRRDASAAARIFGASGVILAFGGVGVSGSRAGLLALLVGVGVNLAGAARSAPRAALAGLGLLLAAAGASLATGWPLSVQRFAALDLGASRLNQWSDMLRVVGWFPGLGHGIGAFGAAYRPYQTIEVYEYWPHAHNDYLEFVLEAGLLGALVVAALGGRAFVRAARTGAGGPPVAALSTLAVFAFFDFPVRLPAASAWLAILLAAWAAAPPRPGKSSIV